MNNPEEENVIEFRNFGFKYTAQSEPTLYDINLKIRRGEKVLICGPSGCGKSTLAHCLNGLIPASYSGEATGELILDGKSFKDQNIFSLSKFVGTVLQDSDGQFIGLTVGEDIAFALENDRTAQAEMKERVKAVAEKVGVGGPFLSHAPHELSGGQKQRVALAGVMVDDVKVLLFDEPLANLDPATGKTTIELIDEIHKNTGTTVVIIEHRLEDVLHRDVDRVILMSEGRIISDSSPAALLSSDLLIKYGIREPLYITALKYAGVKITEEMKPQRIDTLKLSEEDKKKVLSWFEKAPYEKEKVSEQIILKARNIDFKYSDEGRLVLQGINFELHKGEMMAIVGKNGAGKSTFSKLICGFEKPCSGSMELNGTDLEGMSIKERADHIGYVMQNPNQMISKPMIREEVSLGLILKSSLTPQQIDERVDETLKICGLYPFRNWPVSALSFGQKKRVTIASILSMNPEIIILDEPTAGQDFRHYTEIMDFLSDLNKRGITIVLITHDMHLMLEYCSRAVIFADSQMIADKSCEEVLTDSDVVEKACLKKTSLSALSLMCGIKDDKDFIRRFILTDREVRK
ncbi:MAG: ABC transporter ATP-binding protein [Sphaerochaetaceae bacterium]|nr:ABC transporter ATP-binding protein [Sphaerochaetaceae bacterium]